MTRAISILLILSTLFFSFQHPEPPEAKKKKWQTLFNGKNLNGWTMKINGFPMGENFGNTFRVENGILNVRYDQYKSFDNRFGALYYNKKFTNYRLKVEYRFVGELTPGAPSWGFRDSGVQYHGQSPSSVGLNQQFPVCLEFNLHGGNGKDKRPTGEICALGTFVEINGKRNETNCTPPIVKRTFHGDVWVTLEIDVQGSSIAHFINGEEIIRFANPKYKSDHEVAKTFIKANDDAVKEGYISLQSNSHPIDFRKIEIMEYE
jgi:Domain of Unknown Function (DUF1080)